MIREAVEAQRPTAASPKILTIDLERLPGEVTLDVWEPRDFARINYVHPDRWDKLPRTLCFSYRWYGAKTVHFVANWDNRDDAYHCARVAWDLFNEADIVVTFNGKRADIKWLRSDWVMAGLPQPAPWRDVDLFVIARSAFSFESKSLRHLCDRLGVDNKSGHYSAEVAKLAEAGNRAARRELTAYNKQDTRVTELVLDRLRPWIKGVNLGAYYLDDEARCPACGGTDLHADGWYMAAVQRYALYRCACGALSRSQRVKHKTEMRGLA
jgi:hypothetical protein